jgi:hypothetical protein
VFFMCGVGCVSGGLFVGYPVRRVSGRGSQSASSGGDIGQAVSDRQICWGQAFFSRSLERKIQVHASATAEIETIISAQMKDI